MFKKLAFTVAALALVLFAAVAYTPPVKAAAATSAPVLLPGEPTFNGVPAYLFGGNDGVNWDTGYNMDTGPDAAPIQSALKAGGMPIIRAWFFQNSLVDNHALTDAEQLQKLAAVQASGAVCFANFPTNNTVAYDLHLLSVLNGACPLVEVMNEPDIEGVNSTAYLAFWNSFVPQARAQFPGIKFGGPADYDNQGNECTYYSDGTSACFLQKVMQGMKASGNLPDFVTYHWYPCWNNDASSCLALASGFADAAQVVIDEATQIFGQPMPVICSEWNADPGSPSFMYDRTWDGQFVTAALKSMEQSGLAGAMEYDISEYGNYGADDMFDIYNGGAPFQTWTDFAAEIARVQSGTAPSPTPTTPPPSPTPTQPPSPTPTPTQPPTPTPSPTPPPPPVSGLVQSASHVSNTSAKSAVTLKGVTQGDLLVAAVGLAGGNTYSVGSLTDTQGNVWTKAASGTNGDESLAAIYFATAKATGDDTITLQGSGSGFVQSGLTVSEWNGPTALVGGAAKASSGTAHSVTVPSGAITVGVYVDAGYDKAISSSGMQLGTDTQSTVNIQFDAAASSAFTTSGSTYAEVAAASFN